jgi:hypothetical protein
MTITFRDIIFSYFGYLSSGHSVFMELKRDHTNTAPLLSRAENLRVFYTNFHLQLFNFMNINYFLQLTVISMFLMQWIWKQKLKLKLNVKTEGVSKQTCVFLWTFTNKC